VSESRNRLTAILPATGRILLIPVMLWASAGIIHGMARMPLDLQARDMWYCLLGFSVGLVLFALCSPLIRVYVIGHELSHYLVAKLFKRRTRNFRVGKTSGSVDVHRPNVWIVLAPYMVPIYTVIWLLIMAVVSIGDRPEWLAPVTVAGVGLTYAFHVVLTVIMLIQGQTDLKFYGPAFSICLIILVNSACVYGALAVLSGNLNSCMSLLGTTYVDQWQWLKGMIEGF